MVTVTSARPNGARDEVPAKMTSSILPPRSVLAPCSPITHASASTTLDLPDPLGPTTAVMPGSNRRVVGEAKDLKPFSVRLLRYTACQTTAPPGDDAGRRASRGGAGLITSARRRCGTPRVPRRSRANHLRPATMRDAARPEEEPG